MDAISENSITYEVPKGTNREPFKTHQREVVEM